MTKMSRKNKKTLKRKHRKNTKKGTKSIRKMKGGWPFGFGDSDTCDKKLFIRIKNDIIRMNNNNNKNVDINNLKTNIATYIRSNCQKNTIQDARTDDEKKNSTNYNYYNGIYVLKTPEFNHLYYYDKNQQVDKFMQISDDMIRRYLKIISQNDGFCISDTNNFNNQTLNAVYPSEVCNTDMNNLDNDKVEWK